MFEQEKYFLVENLSELLRRIGENGYKQIGSEFQKNFYFDYPELNLFKDKIYLRLRYNFTADGSEEKFEQGEINFSNVVQTKTGIENRVQLTSHFSEREMNFFRAIFGNVLVNSFTLFKKRHYFSITNEIHLELDFDIIMDSYIFHKIKEVESKYPLEPTLQICVEGDKKHSINKLNKQFSPVIESLGLEPSNFLKHDYFERYISKIWKRYSNQIDLLLLPKWIIPKDKMN